MHHLTTREAAGYLGLSHKALERWRLIGQGPVWVKLGHAVRYPRAELEQWVAVRRSDYKAPR